MTQTIDCRMLEEQEEPQQNLALQHSLIMHAIQFSDYFQGSRTPPVFLVHDYFCRQGTVAMEVWLSYPSYSYSLWTVFKSSPSFLLTRTLSVYVLA